MLQAQAVREVHRGLASREATGEKDWLLEKPQEKGTHTQVIKEKELQSTIDAHKEDKHEYAPRACARERGTAAK